MISEVWFSIMIGQSPRSCDCTKTHVTHPFVARLLSFLTCRGVTLQFAQKYLAFISLKQYSRRLRRVWCMAHGNRHAGHQIGINNWTSLFTSKARLHTRACVDPPLFHNFVLWLLCKNQTFESELDSDVVRRKYTFVQKSVFQMGLCYETHI